MNRSEQKVSVVSKWVKRFGFAGFMFFLVKGLGWLFLIFGASYFGLKALD